MRRKSWEVINLVEETDSIETYHATTDDEDAVWLPDDTWLGILGYLQILDIVR